MFGPTNLIQPNVILQTRNYFTNITYKTAIDCEGAIRELLFETTNALKDDGKGLCNLVTLGRGSADDSKFFSRVSTSCSLAEVVFSSHA